MSVFFMCRDCGKEFARYNSIQTRCLNCSIKRQEARRAGKPLKIRKPIRQLGKEAEKWRIFRDKVAIPYLDKKYGHICSVAGCTETQNLDVDHKKPRGSHPELRYVVTNLRYLCRPHHVQVTGVPRWSKKA